MSLKIDDCGLMTTGQAFPMMQVTLILPNRIRNFIHLISKGCDMRQILKRIGIVLGNLFGLILSAIAAVYILSNARFNRTYDIQVEDVEIPTDAAAIEYGGHVATIRGCIDCHGENISGRIEFEDPMTAGHSPLYSGV